MAVPNGVIVKKIANYFKVSTDFLLANDDDGFEGLLMKILRENRGLMSTDEQRFLLEMVEVYIGAIKNKKGREANTRPWPD